MEKIFRVAALHAHDTLILGAWGCGVFQNSPENVARWFATHLLDGAFQSDFGKVIFAILDSNGRTLSPFTQLFMP